jgi:hypothetical protein
MTDFPFRLRPIDPAIANELRVNATVIQVADEKPGYPCRQCLRDAELGEELVLVSYDPFTKDSPYRGRGPIFLHRVPCEPWHDDGRIPQQQLGRRLSFRAYSSNEMMIDAEVIEGPEFQAIASKMLLDERVEFINVHNASPGCWALRVERP